MIRELCNEAKITKPDWISATIGPGSFTGVRLTVSFARNLAQLWKIPVVGINSLHFYAYSLACQKQLPHAKNNNEKKVASSLAIMLDAKQKRIYGIDYVLSQHKQASSPQKIANLPPYDFVSKLPEHCLLYADAPSTISNYANSYMQKTPTPISKRIKQAKNLPMPELTHLHELALQINNSSQNKSWKWEELLPNYLRSDFAYTP